MNCLRGIERVGLRGGREYGRASVWCFGWLAGLLLVATAAAQEKKDDKKESPPEAVALYADAANFQNNGAFELAAEEWSKFLVKFPKDPLATKARHYSGVCNLQLKKFDKAVEAFAAVLKAEPNFEFAEDAQLNLAWSQYSLAGPQKPELYASSQAAFVELLKKFPKGKYVDQALFFQGECLYNQGKKKEAVAPYEQMVKDHAKSPLRCDALYALGVTHEELSQYADAGRIYDLFLAECTTSPLLTEVKMRKAETVLQAGQFADAEKRFAEAVAAAGFSQADHALYRQAFCLTKQDKYAEAAELYGKLPTSFPQSTYVNDATMSAGRCLYRVEKFPEAAVHFQKAIAAKTADSPEAAHWLCRIQLKLKKPAEAVAVADQALAAAGDSPYLVNLKMDRADSLFEIADKRADSLAAYLKVVSDHPKHELAPQALYNAAFASLEGKKYDDGLKYADQFLKAYAKDRLAPDVRYIQAESHLQNGKYAEAEKLYRELTKSHADHSEIDAWRVRFGLSMFLQKKYAETVLTFSPLVASIKAPDALAEAQFLIGASQFQQEKIAEATAALEASLAAAPKWRQADETILYLSRCQRKQNKLTEAKASIARLITEFPASRLLDQAHYRMGEYAYAGDDFKTAVAEYDVVIGKHADSAFFAFALYGKGWSLLKTKDYAGANASFSALLTHSPMHQLAADARFARAMCRRQSGDHAGAVEDVNAYLASNPDLEHKSDALYERGLAEVALKDNAAAAATFATLLKDNAKYPALDKVLYELAWALKAQEKHDEAIVQFARLSAEHSASPLAAEAFFHVGEGQYEKKQFDEAAKSYAQAKQKAKESELAEKSAYKLGWSHFQQKQYAPALTAFSEQLTASPQGPLAGDALFMKAETLFRLENYKEAFPAFTAARQSPAAPARLEALILLHGGQSAAQLKQWAESLKFLEPIPQKHPDSPYVSEAYYEQGWAKQNLGKPDEALKDYEEAATRSRDHVGARARFMIGEIHFEKKNYDEAVKQFQRVMFGFGGEKATPEVKVWQAQAGFETGRCYEVQIAGADAKKKPEMLAAARRNYAYVVEKHPTNSFAAEAKKRLDALSKL